MCLIKTFIDAIIYSRLLLYAAIFTGTLYMSCLLLPTPPDKVFSLSSLQRWRNWGGEKLSSSPEDSQLLSDRYRNKTGLTVLQNWAFPLPWRLPILYFGFVQLSITLNQHADASLPLSTSCAWHPLPLLPSPPHPHCTPPTPFLYPPTFLDYCLWIYTLKLMYFCQCQ